jgi:hypothetical protein
MRKHKNHRISWAVLGAVLAITALPGSANASSLSELNAQSLATARQAAQANLANQMAVWEFAAQKWASDSLYPTLQKAGVSTTKSPFPPVLLYDGNESLCAASSITSHAVNFTGATMTSNGKSHFLPTNFLPPYQGAYCAMVYGGLGTAHVNGKAYPGADVLAYFVPGEEDSHSPILKDLPASSAAMDMALDNAKYHVSAGGMPMLQNVNAGLQWQFFGAHAASISGVSVPTTGRFFKQNKGKSDSMQPSPASSTATTVNGSPVTLVGSNVLNTMGQVVGTFSKGNITWMSGVDGSASKP